MDRASFGVPWRPSSDEAGSLFDYSSAAPPSLCVRASLTALVALAWQLLYVAGKSKWGKDTSCRVIALLHAAYACTGALYVCLTVPVISFPSLCAPVPRAFWVLLVSWGYFWWDLGVSVVEEWGRDYVLHALFCIYIYGIGCLTDFGQKHAVACMLYEISTVLLHTQSFLSLPSLTERVSPSLLLGVRVLFALSFLASRLMFGGWVTYDMWTTYFGPTGECLPLAGRVSILAINALFHCLNLYWFGRLIAIGLGKGEGKDRRDKGAQRAAMAKSPSEGAVSDASGSETQSGAESQSESDTCGSAEAGTPGTPSESVGSAAAAAGDGGGDDVMTAGSVRRRARKRE
ncbi:unnamed protein product [Vitrella brassicaformis CCMP3155]|uniref:TLC domain-containing protein n=2 Tax=Vitrella brassicaformis TaxID=1169539 RepID=A0A0G4E9W5_VITBC|nr:unnamed protein product [Vitrella brassicaformis CCMP3155]|eukprot:CEL92442.1 unnamed protein product [Vitrella brassicaformis CCMP3155]